MKYVSISLETTGPDSLKNDILELGAIIEDTSKKSSYSDCPKLRFWVDKEFYRGDPFTLVRQGKILEKICELRVEKSRRLVNPDDVFSKLSVFIKPHFLSGYTFTKPVTVAGNKFSTIDRMFLRRLKGFDTIPFHQRVLEPCLYAVDFKDDENPPSLEECKKRLGIGLDDTEEEKIDGTLSTAWDVIRVLRTQY